ncbi:MAG: PIF1 family ATP-dependent DNA helicase [Bdellovibrionota bacterium]
MAKINELSPEQSLALEVLHSGENVFLSGGAGSGKTTVIKHFHKTQSKQTFPLLASTGAAAVILGGVTFHSFFGLGIMEGGTDATYQRAMNDRRLFTRLRKVEGVIIDEISMIPGEALMIAEAVAQKARDSRLPWGGMQVISVGDFAQLPPITKTGQRDWSFLNPVWDASGFQNIFLQLNQRVQNLEFLRILGKVRDGVVDEEIFEFLNDRRRDPDDDESGVRLFPLRQQAEDFNHRKLSEINETEVHIDSIYLGNARFIETLKRSAPVPACLQLKIGCEVMLVQNDPQKRWVNGTRGILRDVEKEKLIIEKKGGRSISVEKTTFSLLDHEGNVSASMIQFPVVLAYATTIHKSQGATIDKMWCDLGRLWEPGHAYVALSRLTSPDGLYLLRWDPKSIITDPHVKKFYANILTVKEN